MINQMKISNRLMILVVVTLVCFNPLHAQWVYTNGPYNAFPGMNGLETFSTSIVKCDSCLFAGTGGGVFRSTNRGVTWTSVNNGITNLNITFLVASGSQLIAGTFPNAIFISNNQGANWTEVHTEFTGSYGLSALAVSGSNIYTNNGEDIYRSTNNGVSWIKVGRTPLAITSLTGDGSVLLAGNHSGVLSSIDNGASWKTFGLLGKHVTAISQSSKTIIAGTDSGDIFLSPDNGISWNAAKPGLLKSAISSFAISGDTIFVASHSDGVFRSVDHGATWTEVNEGLTDKSITGISIIDGDVFVATYYDGIFRSGDTGANWSPVNNGFTTIHVMDVFASGTTVFAGTTIGAFYSTNNGINWAKSSLAHFAVSAFTANGSHLYAGTTLNGVFISNDHGVTWKNIGLKNLYIYDLAVCDTNLFVGTNKGIYISNNDGMTWQNFVLDHHVFALAVRDTDVFAGSDERILHFSMSGESRSDIGWGSSRIYSLAISDNTIFAGNASGQIYRATISESNWTEVSDSLPKVTPCGVHSIVVSDRNIFAYREDGVYLSTNNGSNWISVNTQLPHTIGGSCLTVIGQYIWAGTWGNGVWRRPLSEVTTSIQNHMEDHPTALHLQQNYPNPFNPSTEISFSISTKLHVTLKIFDVMGREAATLVSEEMPAGMHKVKWNASVMPSGMYFYRLQAGSYAATKRLVVLK